MGAVGPGLASPNPYTCIEDFHDTCSSYILSPAAMYHPAVFGGNERGEFTDPVGFGPSTVSPTVSQCTHPNLKSRMVEHNWLQSPPSPGSSPSAHLLFNAGAASAPMAPFFDGHVGAMPIRTVLADNETVVKGGGSKLWVDTDITIGPWAEFGGCSSHQRVDGTQTSVHVFTRGGILGRDLISPQ